MTRLMVRAYRYIDANLPLALGVVAALLIVTERGFRERLGGVLAFGASAALGYALLRLFELPAGAPLDAGGLLMPLFGGLFGAPVLLDAIGGEGIPPQGDSDVRRSRNSVGVAAVLGTGAGAIVGYIRGYRAPSPLRPSCRRSPTTARMAMERTALGGSSSRRVR
jgi:putative membrane protein